MTGWGIIWRAGLVASILVSLANAILTTGAGEPLDPINLASLVAWSLLGMLYATDRRVWQ